MPKIKFKRGSNVFTGKVVKIKEHTAIVEVSKATQKKLDIATNLTVVNFKNIVEGRELIKANRKKANPFNPKTIR